MNTSLRNGGRKAGMGICYDDYGDESCGGGICYGSVIVRMPHDGVDPKELNGKVIIVQKGKGRGDNG